VSILITNYNGRRLLEANLPPLLEALEAVAFETEVLVVDDCSTDGSPEFLAQRFPQVICHVMAQNMGQNEALNEGLSRARYPLVYLMNNDIVAREGFLEPLVEHFSDPDIFAVGSKALDPDGRSIFSRMGVGFGLGRIRILRNTDGGAQREASLTLFASAGHGLFDKQKLLDLGGFDRLFRPIYMEELDVCWLAWASGWKVLYEPASVIIHDHQSTMRSLWRRGVIERTLRRNEWLFNWKNIHDPALSLAHAMFLPLLLVAAPFTGRVNLTLSFFQALGRLGALRESRRKAKALRSLSERQIISSIMETQKESF
jgi:GT2 family glycosyltransferase